MIQCDSMHFKHRRSCVGNLVGSVKCATPPCSFVYIPVPFARPACVTRRTLPPLSPHDPEPTNWSLVCSTQASKVPAKAFKSRRVVQSRSANVPWYPLSLCGRAEGSDGRCRVAWNGLSRDNTLLKMDSETNQRDDRKLNAHYIRATQSCLGEK